MVVNVEIIHERALYLLSEMENLKLIRVTPPVKNTVGSQGTLSQQFAGALRISNTAYDTFQNTLQEGRNNWQRDIC